MLTGRPFGSTWGARCSGMDSKREENRLGRPHIEFIAAQVLPWVAGPAGEARPEVEAKVLSQDGRTGAASLLLRYPAGFAADTPHWLTATEEFLVLEGELLLNGRAYGTHAYANLPPGYRRHTMASPRGATALVFFDRAPRTGQGTPPAVAAAELVEHRDSIRMDWDGGGDVDPGLAFMGIRRKTLRRDPARDQRATFLIATAPHNHPQDWACPSLTHPCVEECFMLAGDLTGPQGVLHAGCYFWRPPGIPHGPFGSLCGSLSLIRFVDGKHVNVWGNEALPYSYDVPHAPVLPAELAALGREPYRGAQPW